MRILVTGGTGFVGQHLIKALIEKKAKVTCLVRASTKHNVFEPAIKSQINFMQADLSNGQGLKEALAEQDFVIHLAALLFGLKWQDYIQANALTSELMGQNIEKYAPNLKKFIMISSLAATGPSGIAPGVKDNAASCPVSAYGWSKYISEQILKNFLHEKMVTLRPPIIYGSGDKGLLPYFKTAQMGIIINPGFGKSLPMSIIHVYDIVQAIILCLNDKSKGIYHLNDGGSHTMESIGRNIAKALEKKAVVVPIPLVLMKITAHMAQMWASCSLKFGARMPSWNIDKYLEAKQEGWLCDSARIKNELGFEPIINISKGMNEAVLGYRLKGLL